MRNVRRLVVTLFLLVIHLDVFSQCAMCKAAVESSEEGNGFNDAIIFLMLMPYLIGLVALIFFIYYKKKRK